MSDIGLTLITGATGAVGSAIALQLHQQGRPLRCLVRNLDAARPHIPAGVELVKGDLTDPASIRAAMVGVKRVFHAGGIPEQWLADASTFQRINTDGTKHMLDAAIEAGVERFVYTSTQDLFDLDTDPFDETMPYKGKSPSAYEASKHRAQKLVDQAGKDGLSVVSLHPAAVYGPGAATVVGMTGLLQELMQNKVPVLLEGGLPVVFNADCARAHILAESHPGSGDGYIIYDSYQSLEQIAAAVAAVHPDTKIPSVMPGWVASLLANTGELISKLTKKPPLVSRAELSVLRRPGRPSSAKVRKELGWTTTPFAEGVEITIKWLKENAA